MACIVCGREPEGDGLRLQITALGELPETVDLPDGGIDVIQCGDCWRWFREIAADELLPELLPEESNDVLSEPEVGVGLD